MPIRSNASWTSCRAASGALAALVLPFLLFACASVRPGPPSPPGVPGTPPWEIPASALGTQQLFRMSYKGPGGEGSFRLALKMESAGRYQALAADPLGRALWSLDVAAGRGLFLDHRARAACPLDGSLSLAGAPLDRIELADLPKLLLGRVPVTPRETKAAEASDEIDLAGPKGEVWKVKIDEGRPVRWVLLRDGRRAASWEVEKGESELADRSGGKLRWRSSVAEPLSALLLPLKIPSDYASGGCAALKVSREFAPRPDALPKP